MNYGSRFHNTSAFHVSAYGLPPVTTSKAMIFATPLQKEFMVAKAKATRNKDKITLPGIDMRIKKKPNERLIAEERMISRIMKAMEILSFGLEELSMAKIDDFYCRQNRRLLGHTDDAIIEIIRRLASIAKVPAPTFAVHREAGRTATTKRCIDCGAHHNQIGNPRCEQCQADIRDSKAREQSEQRRNREQNNQQIAADIKRISKTFRDIQKAGKK